MHEAKRVPAQAQLIQSLEIWDADQNGTLSRVELLDNVETCPDMSKQNHALGLNLCKLSIVFDLVGTNPEVEVSYKDSLVNLPEISKSNPLYSMAMTTWKLEIFGRSCPVL